MIVVAAAIHLAFAMAIFSSVETRFAVDPRRRWWRRPFIADAVLWISHPLSAAFGMALAASIVGVLPHLAFASRVEALPGWAQVALAFLFADLGAYALHRVYHRMPLLFSFHVVHHTSRELDWLSTSRLHPVSQAVNAAIIATPLLVCGLPVSALLVANALIGLWAVIVHANARLELGKLDVVVVSPAFHRHHHGRAVGAKNLGAVLSVWDRVFGTFEKPAPTELGTDVEVAVGVVGLVMHPFTRFPTSRRPLRLRRVAHGASRAFGAGMTVPLARSTT